MTVHEHPLVRLMGPSVAGWRALEPRLRRAVLQQLEHLASPRVARELGRLLQAPWWGGLDVDDRVRAVRVVAYASASADGARREPGEPCRRTILDNSLDSLLAPRDGFALRFRDLPLQRDAMVAGLCLPPATVVLNRRLIAPCDARLGEGPQGWLEVRAGTSTLAHEINHLHNLVPPGPTYAAFQDEYRAWYVGFVVEAARPPRRAEALDRCRELLTSPCYAALRRAVTSGSEEGERILGFLRAFGPVQRLEDLLALPRDRSLDPAPLPRPRLVMSNAPAARDGKGVPIRRSA